tara:strand:- start:31612 stop:31854 length:243 start_codon:yes stop_codon:yes gene_type:complete
MQIVIYVKKGCPYCQRVLQSVKENQGKEVEIYTADEDFKTTTFKEKYGSDTTFPRGYLVVGKEVKLIGGSDSIISELEKD